MFGAPLSWLSGYLPPPSTQEFDIENRFDRIESEKYYNNFPEKVKYDELKKYVDEVYCLSVIDSFVMNAWAKDQKIEKVKMITDGNGAFTQGMDMLVNKEHLGFAQRTWRYSALIINNEVVKMFAEPGKNDHGDDNDPFEVSDVDTMLKYLRESK